MFIVFFITCLPSSVYLILMKNSAVKLTKIFIRCDQVWEKETLGLRIFCATPDVAYFYNYLLHK